MIIERVDAAMTKAINNVVQKYVDNYFYNRKLNIKATASFEE